MFEKDYNIWIRQYEYKHLHCESGVRMHHTQMSTTDNQILILFFSCT